MKQRIISAVYGLSLLAVVLFLIHTPFFNVMTAAFSLIAVYEIFKAANLLAHKPLFAVSALFAVSLQFLEVFGVTVYASLVYFVYFAAYLMCIVAVKSHPKLDCAAISLCVVLLVSTMFYSLTIIKSSFLTSDNIANLNSFLDISAANDLFNDTEKFHRDIGLMLVMLCIGGAWIADAGAYFTGKAFGKHKLCPVISPHKTVEGAVGGIVINGLCFLIIGFCFQVFSFGGYNIYITAAGYIALFLLGLICAPLSILGDLLFSYIKRYFNIKDYGKLIPGHGGVLDRFDSMSVIAPLLTVIIYYSLK